MELTYFFIQIVLIALWIIFRGFPIKDDVFF